MKTPNLLAEIFYFTIIMLIALALSNCATITDQIKSCSKACKKSTLLKYETDDVTCTCR